MTRIFNRVSKHTDAQDKILYQTAFKDIKIKNQPEKSIYTQTPRFAHWWESGDPLKVLMGITAYIHLGNKVGFGLNEKAVNWNTVPKFMDRASPYFWF